MKYVTDYGTVELGPKFLRRMEELQYDIDSKPKRSKSYKEAKRAMERTEVALSASTESELAQGRTWRKTP